MTGVLARGAEDTDNTEVKTKYVRTSKRAATCNPRRGLRRNQTADT